MNDNSYMIVSNLVFRYWGNSYPRLLKIKEHWDPNRVFDHCHSVGSTRNDCCPL